MEAGAAGPAELLQDPWLPVAISGCQLLAKSWFGETAYRVLLTDTRCVWEESMESAAIQRRAQELNRRLRAPVAAFYAHLRDVAQPYLSGSGRRAADHAQLSLTRQPDGSVSVKLKSELAGLPFYWEFACGPAPVSVVCVQLVRPLLTMSCLLQRQVEQLGGLLVRKDAEIQDYRENGAKLSRERLQTDVFDEQTYSEHFMAKTLPLLCSDQPDSLTFDPDLQHLYAAVVTHGNARKRELSEEDRPTEEAGVSSALGVADAGEAEDGEQSSPPETAGSKMADRPAVQQSLPVTSGPAQPPPSKPKKKKVGLFR